jgi:predicted RNA binding protein YcfA (HicA-like mRNA interferase family)
VGCALKRAGFELRRGKGSHHIYQHPDGRRVLAVYHNLGDTFGAKTIQQMLRSTGWNEADVKH